MMKPHTCPYCDYDTTSCWVAVDMIQELMYCPRCQRRIDIRKKEELEK